MQYEIPTTIPYLHQQEAAVQAMDKESLWVAKLIQGDEHCFKLLYDTYSARVYNTAISYTKNTEDAEELLQDVFLAMYDHARKFKFESSVSTWIYRLTVNKSLDFLRKKNAQKRYGIFSSIYKKNSVELNHDHSDFIHPGSRLENKQDAAILFGAIEKLSDNQKTAFILTQIEGLPQKEVAQIMQVSRKSVESLLQRSKANLKVYLGKSFPNRGRKNHNTSTVL